MIKVIKFRVNNIVSVVGYRNDVVPMVEICLVSVRFQFFLEGKQVLFVRSIAGL